MDAGRLQSDLVLLGHYHFHTQVVDGMWYAGSTDTFSFADDPDKAKGIVVLDTDTGDCRHVPLTGQRPLVTLETVFALGLSPAEVQERVLERAATVPEGAVARLYLEGVDPEAYRLLDLAGGPRGRPGRPLLKLEPQFAAVAHACRRAPEMDDAWAAAWERYLERSGPDRSRPRAGAPTSAVARSPSSQGPSRAAGLASACC